MTLALALFAAGLASGLHCAGMCGGIGAGFSVLQREQVWPRQLAFNAGRITSYAAAGAAAGALGSAGAYVAAVLPAQAVLYLFSSAFILAAGVHFAVVPLPLSRLKQLGLPVWRAIQPWAVRWLPARTLPQAFAAGMAWGWLPCGLVYGALLAAVFAGAAMEGAIAMAAFGAGTLPWLLLAGVAAARLRQWARRRELRRALGLVLIGAGGWGVAAGVRQAILCL